MAIEEGRGGPVSRGESIDDEGDSSIQRRSPSIPLPASSDYTVDYGRMDSKYLRIGTNQSYQSLGRSVIGHGYESSDFNGG